MNNTYLLTDFYNFFTSQNYFFYNELSDFTFEKVKFSKEQDIKDSNKIYSLDEFLEKTQQGEFFSRIQNNSFLNNSTFINFIIQLINKVTKTKTLQVG